MSNFTERSSTVRNGLIPEWSALSLNPALLLPLLLVSRPERHAQNHHVWAPMQIARLTQCSEPEEETRRRRVFPFIRSPNAKRPCSVFPCRPSSSCSTTSCSTPYGRRRRRTDLGSRGESQRQCPAGHQPLKIFHYFIWASTVLIPSELTRNSRQTIPI